MEPIRGKNEINDPSYRYKMHKLNFQRERTKTCITNLNVIADDLKIPDQDLIVSYFKKRLAIAITGKDDRVIITNDVSTPSIQTALYEFIEYFVLCKICRHPELAYSLDKKHLSLRCKGCGKIDTVESNQYTEKVIKSFELKLEIIDASNQKLKKKKEKDST